MQSLFLAICLAIVVRLIPRKRDYLSTCNEIIAQLPPSEYDDLCDYAPSGDRSHDMSFWMVSRGIRGILARMRVSYLYLRIIQAHVYEKYIGEEEARQMWQLLLVQIGYSLLALPEAVFCRVFNVRHMAARHAVDFYCKLVLRTNILCYSSTSTKCPIGLDELL